MLAILRKDALSDDKERLEQLLFRMEKRVADAFRKFIDDATSEPVVRLVLQLVQQNRINEALAVIDQHVATLATVITTVFQDSATAEAVAILHQVVGSGAAPVSISFDPTNPRAANIMRSERLEFIREFGDEQRAVTHEALVAGIQAGEGPRRIATDFKASIGLTRKQEQAVKNYRRMLEAGDPTAIDRALSDGHNWSEDRKTTLKAKVSAAKLPQDRIDRMVESYRRRYIAYRAEMLSRTEAGRALSLARDEAMQQQIDAGIVSAAQVEQRWNVILDGRERFWHETMSGQKQPWGQPFIDGRGNKLRYPHDPLAPAETVIGCRCSKTLRILKAY